MFQLYYCSRPSEQLSLDHVSEILKVAQRKNKEKGLTGVLFFNPQFFLQCLEGSRDAVNEVFQRIQKDPRHHDVKILSAGEVVHRDYSDWSMGLANEKKVNRAVYLRYSSTGHIDPFELSSEASRLFMLELSQSALISAGE